LKVYWQISLRIQNASWQIPLSYGDFQHAIISIELRGRNVNGQATLNCFIEIPQQLLERLALSGASGDGWNLGPITALFRVVDDDFDFHGPDYTAIGY
jgi:hypothetical protein